MEIEEQETGTPEETATETEEVEPAGEHTAEASDDDDEDAIEDEVTVTVSGATPQPSEPAEERDPKLVNKLRKLLREQERKVREYETRLKTAAPGEPLPPTLGAKPKLEDHDYDAERYETAIGSWFERKRAADEHAARQKQGEDSQRKAWQVRLDGYAKAKASLRVRDYDEAEHAVTSALDVTQQGIIVSGSDNPALVTYALGKDAAKLAELKAITDPVRFAFAVAKLETKLKVSPKAKPPTPEQTPKGSAPKSSSDSTLERLRDEAMKSGNADKLVAYKRQLKSASK